MNSETVRPRHSRLLLAAVVLFALALRMTYLWFNAAAPDFDSPVLDPQLNDYWARALVSGDWTAPPHADDPEIRSTPYGRPPGYPWLLAALYYGARGSYLAPRIVQIGIGLITVLLVYWMSRRIFGYGTGIAAALFMAVYWAAVYFEGELNSPVWEIALALALVCLLLRWGDSRAWPFLFGAGLCLGMGALIRPNVLLTGGAVALWVGWVDWHKGERLTGTVIRCCVVGCACLVVVAPVLLRNWIVAREFVLISYYGGINAYIGNNPDSDGASPKAQEVCRQAGMDGWNCFNYPRLVRGLGRHLNKPDLGYSEASRYFYGKAAQFWMESPAKAIRLTLRKACLFWGPHEISDSKVIHYERVRSPLLSWLPGFPLLIALALPGIVATFRARSATVPYRDGAALPALYILAYFLSVLPFFIAGRYRFPVAPFLMPFAGYALVVFGAQLSRKNFRGAVRIAACMVVTYALARWSVIPYTPDLATWHTHRGIAHAARDRIAAATAEFTHALDANPENSEAHLQMGFIHTRQGHDEEALRHFHAAVQSAPHNALAHNNLGYIFFRRGALDEAEHHYHIAIELQPDLTLALNNLGNLLLEQGRTEAAITQFEAVLAINPQDPHGRYNIGNALLAQEHYEEAEAAYRLAFELQPRNPNIANNLGLALARQGKLEAAVEWFHKALEAAPVYPLAHFNLGNVCGDLGRIEEARGHFERCLQHWPDHKEARERLDLLSGTL